MNVVSRNLPLNATDNSVRFHSPVMETQMTFTDISSVKREESYHSFYLPMFSCSASGDQTAFLKCNCGFNEHKWE